MVNGYFISAPREFNEIIVLKLLEIYMQKNEVASYTKFILKLTKDLSVKANFISILQENIGINLCELQFGNDFKSTS